MLLRLRPELGAHYRGTDLDRLLDEFADRLVVAGRVAQLEKGI